jgi:hypothetical protein
MKTNLSNESKNHFVMNLNFSVQFGGSYSLSSCPSSKQADKFGKG